MSKTATFLFLVLLLSVHRRGRVADGATLVERAALLTFKSQIGSDPNGVLSSWTPSFAADPCRDFYGVSCSETGDVYKVHIHGAGLGGVLSPSLAALPSVRIISLAGNRLTGGIPTVVASIPTLYKLNVSRNSLSGPVPAALGRAFNLRLLDLSFNNFSGRIPPELFSLCFRTRFVSLAHNSLSGPVPPLSSCSSLEGVDFSFNALTGDFPATLCSAPAVSYVSFRSNFMSGTIFDKVSGCQSLTLFDVGTNSFDGPAPFDLLRLRNLTYFNVSYNGFNGVLPNVMSCGEKMEFLDASSNQLGGEIGPSIAECRGLRVLSLSTNQLGGNIPPEIGQLRSLSVLRLGGNAMLDGEIPPEIGSMELLMVLDLHGLNLTGQIPSTISNLRFILQLDASSNHLSGEIPQTLYNMTYLKMLDLHSNQLTGGIPETIGLLSGLESLDLSQNSLNGSIPASLGNLSQLSSFNLSYNNLSGEIPTSDNLQRFGASAFFHNAGLCGPPLDVNCPGVPEAGVRRARLLSVSAIVAIVAAAIILVGVCVITVINFKTRRRSGGREEEEILVSESITQASNGSSLIIGKLVLFSKSLPSRNEDWEAGRKALLDKDCVIGSGTLGTVYKASLQGGICIAVKKLETRGRIQNQDEFEQEIGRLGSLQHVNLVALQGYYWSSTMQLILSEFVANGNLHQHLHRNGNSESSGGRRRGDLNWSRRFGIALGTARALAYLHHDCKPQILHLNIKATNILLDEKYSPKLSDYGLVKLLPLLGSRCPAKFHSAMGYVAPELAAQSLSFSEKCDVYSFGIILLELVTGRRPVESPATAEVVVLCDYVRLLLEGGRASDCFDRSLQLSAENELIQVLKLGLICTSDAAGKRPSMAEVVQFLESINPNSIGGGIGTSS